MRKRLLVVGAGFVCGGVLVSGLAYAIGFSPAGEDVMRAGLIGGTVPILIGVVLIVAGLVSRR